MLVSMDAICDNYFVPKFCCLTNDDWCVPSLIKRKNMTLKHIKTQFEVDNSLI
jgi:hypothetical protein